MCPRSRGGYGLGFGVWDLKGQVLEDREFAAVAVWVPGCRLKV